MEEKAGTCLVNDVTTQLVEYEGANNFQEDVMGMFPDVENDQCAHFEREVRKEDPHLFALTRQRYPPTPPTGKKLETIKAQMLRVHKSPGHTSFYNLARRLRIRGIGHTVTPAEPHHLLGPEEGAIPLLKGTAARLLKEVEDMEVELAFTLAAHGQNEFLSFPMDQGYFTSHGRNAIGH